MTQHREHDEPGGDAFVVAAWRQASIDEPSAPVDAAILAAARAEVRHRAPAQRSEGGEPWWSRWQPLAAAAGVAGLALVLVQLLPRNEQLRAPPASDSTPMREESTNQSPPEQAAATVPPPPVTAEPPAAAKSVPPPMAAEANVAAEATVTNDTMAGAARESTAGLPARTAWVDRIMALHSHGDLAAAATELRAFRQAYPDADQFLPEPLRTWAASVPAADTR